MKKYLSQAYCCSECDKFVIAYTTRLNEPYEYMFFGCKVLARDSYCPFCGKKSISGDEPPWDELERNMKRMYGMPGMPEEPEDDDEDEDDDRYRRTKDTWWDIEENDEDPEDNEPDPHNWFLPESDKTVKEFLCGNCGEHFKVGYMDGRKRHAFCPLCGGKGSRVKEQG